MKIAEIALGLLATAIGSQSFAKEEQPYIGADFSLVGFNTSTADLNMNAVRLRAGSELTEHLGVEVHAGQGVTDDTAPVTGGGGSLTGKVKTLYGVYVRGNYPLGDVLAVYGTLGYAWLQLAIDANAPRMLDKVNAANDISAGIGAEIKILSTVYVDVDYTEYTQGLTALSLGVRFPL